MSIEMFFWGGLTGFVFTRLVFFLGLFEIIKEKHSWETARKLNIIIPLIVAIIVGSIFGIALSSPNTNSNTSSSKVGDLYGHDEFDAVVIAEKIVKNNLKSPSTAKFCKHSEYTVTCSGNTWTVRGYVDAQNSFGATLRNEFTVKFTFTSSREYTIDYCNIK